MLALLLAPYVALAAPVPAAFECDRLVAMGDLNAARKPCTAAEADGDLDTLAAVQAGAGKSNPVAAVVTLEQAERARKAAPHRIIEEAVVQQAARVVRALVAPEQRPELAKWPLPDLPVPTPTLPPIKDAALEDLASALDRSEERIRETRARLAGVGPGGRLTPAARASLTEALGRMDAERHRLLEQRMTLLEQRVLDNPRPQPTQMLHLADCYFAIDADLSDVAKRRKRGWRMLRRLRKYYPNDGAAGIAALWMASFALDDGDAERARPLLDEAGPFDPGLSTFFEALLQWRLGDLDDALTRVRTIRGPLSTGLTAHVAALEALLALETGNPLAAARSWRRAADHAPAPQAVRARLNAALAWSEGTAGQESPERIPMPYRRDAYLYSLSRGRLDQADKLLQTMEATRPAPDLPFLALQLVDAWRASGKTAAADRLLGRMVTTYAASGAWRSANMGETADTARGLIVERLDARLDAVIATGIPLPPNARASVSALAAARLDVIPSSDRRKLTLAEGLASLGFIAESTGVLTRLRDQSIDPQLRNRAGIALIEALIYRAREAGARGAPTGQFLDGPALRKPLPPEVTDVITAQTELIGRLPLGSIERDSLTVDRAAIRGELGAADDDLELLPDIIERHLDNALAVRAVYLWMRLAPKRAESIARTFARRNIGPTARTRGLQRTLDAAYAERGNDEEKALMSQGRFIEAARRYAAQVDPKSPDAGASAQLATAVAWTLALYPIEAEAAWRRFVTTWPTHAQTPVAYIHLAKLLETQSHRRAAAAAYEDTAARGGPDAPEALLRAIGLLSSDHAGLLRVVQRFVDQFEAHPEAARLRVALAALRSEQAPDTPPAGAPPARIPPGTCRGEACREARFWPTRER